jgi:hypothetical protein
LGSVRQVPHVTELCLFAAAFILAFTYGPSGLALVRKLVSRARRS